MDKNIIDRLQDQVKDEREAVELYTKLANEIDNKGFYRRAHLIRTIAADEQRHITILKDAIEEIKTIGSLVGSASRGPAETHAERMARQEKQLAHGEELLEKGREILSKTRWRVRLGSDATIETFDTLKEAKKYVEERAGKYFSEAHWINPYGFELGPFVGPNFITFLEEDENGTPTERHTWGQFT